MGAAASSVGETLQQVVDRAGVLLQAAVLNLLYVVLVSLCLAAIFNGGAFASLMGLLAPLVHLGVVVAGLTLVDGLVLYPLTPRSLYFTADVAHFVAFGLALGGTAATATGACALLVLAELPILYRNYVLVADVWRGRRDGRTGAPLTPAGDLG